MLDVISEGRVVCNNRDLDTSNLLKHNFDIILKLLKLNSDTILKKMRQALIPYRKRQNAMNLGEDCAQFIWSMTFTKLCMHGPCLSMVFRGYKLLIV